MFELSSSETTGRVRQLEWPQEVARLFEVGTDGEDLVDQIFHADNAELAKVVLNELVVSKCNASLIDLAIATLIDKLSDRLQVGIAVCDVRIDNSEHFLCSLGQADEDTVVDLK